MDALTEAVVFLLAAYVEVTGARYACYIEHMGDLEKGDTLGEVLREKSDKLAEDLGKAKAYIAILTEGVQGRPDRRA